MTERTGAKDIKVGDTIAWSRIGYVPEGTLLRHKKGWHALRSSSRHSTGPFRWVQMDGEWSYRPSNWGTGGVLENGDGWHAVEGEATVVAMGLTREVTEDDLRTLAEIFEVREAVSEAWGEDLAEELAERLHAAGWRPGDTAERAAELLATQEAP